MTEQLQLDFDKIIKTSNISKKDISTACRISEVTISKCYKELLKYHKYLLPKEILEKLY